MKSKVIIFPTPNRVELTEIDVPEPAPGQLLTKTVITGVSTGTETRVWHGTEDPRAFPLIPGYENIGEIVAVGKGVSFEPGSLVFHSGSHFTGDYTRLWGAHCQYCLIRADDLILVPDDVAPRDAVYILVGAIALHGIHRGKVTANDKVAIAGVGLIGHLAVQNAKAIGAHVIAIDFDQARLDAVASAGADVCLQTTGINLEEQIKEQTGGGVDVVVDVTGVPHAADSFARLIKTQPWAPPYPPNGRVVLLGSYAEPVCFHYHPTLFDTEPDILPSRYCTRAEMQQVIEMIKNSQLRPDAIPQKTYPVDAAIAAYRELVEQKLMRVLFEW